MEIKKAKDYQLENRRPIFVLMGLIVSISFVFSAFEYRYYSEIEFSVDSDEWLEMEQVELEVQETFVLPKKTSTPPPPPVAAKKTKMLDLQNLFIGDYSQIVADVLSNPWDIDDFSDMEFDFEGEGSHHSGLTFDAEKMYCQKEVSSIPKFGRGDSDLDIYIKNTLKISSYDYYQPGTHEIKVRFVVNKDGVVENVRIVNGGSLNTAILRRIKRLFEKMPNWIPGEYGTTPVRVELVKPINIELN